MGCVQSICEQELACDYLSPRQSEEGTVDLSNFQLMPYLGIGGSGLVRAAKKLTGADRNCVYAVKSIKKFALLQKTSGPNSAITELRILSILDSPFICNCHYGFQDDSNVYFVLDLAVGGDMKYNLRNSPRGRFTEQTTLFFISQVLLALDHCHKKGILHRDIKPENILLGSTGYIKLTDFGVSKQLSEIENCISTSGTHGYMAPEVYIPPHKHGITAEWFSVGVTCFEFMAGSRPFECHRFKSCIRAGMPFLQIDVTELKEVGQISDCAIDFVAQLLEISPTSRLGARNGLEGIIVHPWTIDFNWNAVIAKTMAPPIIPDLSYQKFDAGNALAQQAIQDRCRSVVPLSDADQKKFSIFHLRDGYYSSFFPKESCREEKEATTNSIAWTQSYEIASSFHDPTLASDSSCVGSPSGQDPLFMKKPRILTNTSSTNNLKHLQQYANLSIDVSENLETSALQEYKKHRALVPPAPRFKSSKSFTLFPSPEKSDEKEVSYNDAIFKSRRIENMVLKSPGSSKSIISPDEEFAGYVDDIDGHNSSQYAAGKCSLLNVIKRGRSLEDEPSLRNTLSWCLHKR